VRKAHIAILSVLLVTNVSNAQDDHVNRLLDDHEQCVLQSFTETNVILLGRQKAIERAQIRCEDYLNTIYYAAKAAGYDTKEFFVFLTERELRLQRELRPSMR